jgi:hypothetical protein
MASSGWIADRAKEIMTTEPNIGPRHFKIGWRRNIM